MIGTQNLLEQFVTFGRLQKDFEILKHKVTMRTMDSGQLLDVWTTTGYLDKESRNYAIIIETLARIIMAIDGQTVMYVPENEKDPYNMEKFIEQKKKTIKKWSTSLVSYFYDKYNELEIEQNKQMEELKNASASSGQEKSGKSEKN